MEQSKKYPGTYTPDDLAYFAEFYRDVCDSVGDELGIGLTPQVRETVAQSIFNQAATGDVSRARLRARAMRAVEAYAGMKPSALRKASGLDSSTSPARTEP